MILLDFRSTELIHAQPLPGWFVPAGQAKPAATRELALDSGLTREDPGVRHLMIELDPSRRSIWNLFVAYVLIKGLRVNRREPGLAAAAQPTNRAMDGPVVGAGATEKIRLPGLEQSRESKIGLDHIPRDTAMSPATTTINHKVVRNWLAPPTERSVIPDLSAAIREDLHKQLLSLIPSLRAFARSLTRDHSETEDLVQDTLVKAISNFHQFAPGTNLRAWLLAIERNTYLNEKRRQRALVPLDDDRTVSVSPTQEWSVQMSAVYGAVLELPPEQRRALMLVAADGLTCDEAAEVCDCAPGTIKSRINRARHRLEELL
jgi:RNA polymerase sigma-70 factor (ECF subfamily)